MLSQRAANDAGGRFADSFSVPNYLGGDQYDPALPALDDAFEAEWTSRIESFITFVQGRFAGRYYLIPNVGDWVTGRDATRRRSRKRAAPSQSPSMHACK